MQNSTSSSNGEIRNANIPSIFIHLLRAGHNTEDYGDESQVLGDESTTDTIPKKGEQIRTKNFTLNNKTKINKYGYSGMGSFKF